MSRMCHTYLTTEKAEDLTVSQIDTTKPHEYKTKHSSQMRKCTQSKIYCHIIL